MADEKKIAQHKLHNIGHHPRSKIKVEEIKYHCQEYNDGSRNIPNLLNGSKYIILLEKCNLLYLYTI